MLATVLIALASLAQTPSQELFRDPTFTRGFTLSAASHPTPKIEIGVLETNPLPDAVLPEWRLAQWGTRTVLESGFCTRTLSGALFTENPAKRIEIEHLLDGPTRFLLEVRGAHEYEGRLRASGEAWPHLLVEQSFPEPIRLEKLAQLQFALGMRVAACKALVPAEKLDPGLHTAQVSAYWTVHDLTPGRGDMIWFGIPIFDARYEVPPAHYAIDGGKADASGKFICVLDGKRFWQGPTGDGTWRDLDTDLLPLLREALEIAQRDGHLKEARFEDLAITSFNLGWEVPGPYDCAIEFRGLSMKGTAK